MTFVSDLSRDFVPDDSDVTAFDVPDGLSSGYEERDWALAPYGAGYAKPFDIPIIPRDEWRDRIEEMEKTESRLSDICELYEIEAFDQNGTNYCWGNGVVQCVQIVKAAQGHRHIPLSPASVCAPITRYRNVGGWGEQALEYIAEYGIAPQSLWPANAIDKKYDTDQCRKAKLENRITEWSDIEPRNFDQQMTCALLRIPHSVAYNWWRHLVMALDPVAGPGWFGLRVLNSWTVNWGTNGMAVFKEGYGRNRANADEAIAPRVITAS